MRSTRGAEAEMWKTWDPAEPGTDLWGWQARRCAWCGHKDDALVKDHCHLTGLIRGLLCHGCNQLEGNDWRGIFDDWRAGDNPAYAIKHFEVYRNQFGGTPISPRGALYWFSPSEQAAWFEVVVKRMQDGATWPKDAPWLDTALARKEEVFAQMRTADCLTTLPEASS